MIRLISILALSFCLQNLLSACAQPKYLQGAGASDPVLKKEKLAGSCELRFKVSGLCLDWAWQNRQPAAHEITTLTFKIYRPSKLDQTPVVVDELELGGLLLWMPDMGHDAGLPPTIEKIDIGTYRASDIEFIMTGKWEIHFQMKYRNANGEVVADEAVTAFTIED